MVVCFWHGNEYACTVENNKWNIIKEMSEVITALKDKTGRKASTDLSKLKKSVDLPIWLKMNNHKCYWFRRHLFVLFDYK